MESKSMTYDQLMALFKETRESISQGRESDSKANREFRESMAESNKKLQESISQAKESDSKSNREFRESMAESNRKLQKTVDQTSKQIAETNKKIARNFGYPWALC